MTMKRARHPLPSSSLFAEAAARAGAGFGEVLCVRRAMRSGWRIDASVLARAMRLARAETVASCALDLGFSALPLTSRIPVRLWRERRPRSAAEARREAVLLASLGSYPHARDLLNLAARFDVTSAPDLRLAAACFRLAVRIEGPGGPAEFRMALVELACGRRGAAVRRLERLRSRARRQAWRRHAAQSLEELGFLAQRTGPPAQRPPRPSSAGRWRRIGRLTPAGRRAQVTSFYLPG